MKNTVSWDDVKMLIGFGTIFAGIIYFSATISTRQESMIDNQGKFETRLNQFGTEQVEQGKDIAIIKEAMKAQGLISNNASESSTIARVVPNVIALRTTTVSMPKQPIVYKTVFVTENKTAGASATPTSIPTPTPIICLVGICIDGN